MFNILPIAILSINFIILRLIDILYKLIHSAYGLIKVLMLSPSRIAITSQTNNYRHFSYLLLEATNTPPLLYIYLSVKHLIPFINIL